jgi:malate synthase
MKKDNVCFSCGAYCSGKMQVQMRSNGEPKPFCTNCFNLSLQHKIIEGKKEQ